MVRKLAGALLTLSVLDAQVAHSLGLGELTLNSTLNQPLDAQVRLTKVGELDASQIRIKLATENDFNRAGVERLFFLTDLRFRVEVDGKGGGTLFINSHKLVREPFLNFIMETRWPSGRLMREYTVLIDLPVYSDAQPVANIKPAEQVITQPDTASSGTIIRQASSQVTSPQPASLENKPANVDVKRQSSIDGESYTTQVNDTLWEIAAKARPDSSVSVQQTMLAIQQKNPDAFINGNINRLKVAKNLQLPDLAEIRNRSRQQAVADVQQQNSNASGGDDRVIEAGNADSQQVEAGRHSESGQLRLKTPSEDGGSAGTGSGGDQSGVETALVGSQENLSKVQRENQELQSRLNDMDTQVEDLQRVIALQNARLERLQAQSGEEQQVITDTEVVVVDEQGEVVAVDEVVETVTVDIDESGDLTVTDEVVEELAVAQEPQAEPVKPVVLPAALAEDSSFIDELIEDPVYIGAAGGLALLAFLLVAMRRRKKSEEEQVESEFDDAMTTANPLVDELEQAETEQEEFENLDFDAADEQQEIESLAQEDASEESFMLDEEFESLSGDETLVEEDFISEYDEPLEQEVSDDAAGEADVYMAYGRYDQAIEILDTALAVTPNDEALHLKKMEVLANSGQREGFVAHYHLMAGLVGAAALAQATDLLSGVSDGAQWSEDINAVTAGSGLEQDLDLDVALGDELELDDIEDFTAADQEDDIVADDAADLAELDSMLLDDLDSELEIDAPELDEDELSIDGFDDDLSLSLDDADLSLELDDLAEAETETTETSLPEGLDDLDIEMSEADIELISGLDDSELPNLDDEDLPELDDLSLMASLDVEAPEQESGNLADFDAAEDFDLSDGLELSEDLDLSEDLNLGDLDLTAFDDTAASAEEAELDDSSVDDDLMLDLEDDEPQADESVASDEDEVATKLDLARAYIDIGDDDGARDILDEVVQEGDDGQRVEAEELLARIN